MKKTKFRVFYTVDHSDKIEKRVVQGFSPDNAALELKRMFEGHVVAVKKVKVVRDG